jgi:hypothetical protein
VRCSDRRLLLIAGWKMEQQLNALEPAFDTVTTGTQVDRCGKCPPDRRRMANPPMLPTPLNRRRLDRLRSTTRDPARSGGRRCCVWPCTVISTSMVNGRPRTLPLPRACVPTRHRTFGGWPSCNDVTAPFGPAVRVDDVGVHLCGGTDDPNPDLDPLHLPFILGSTARLCWGLRGPSGVAREQLSGVQRAPTSLVRGASRCPPADRRAAG